jgi:ribosome biogenesis GTPase
VVKVYILQTFAEMYDLPFGGKIIDTPGLREFALMDIPRHELGHFFPEMRALINDCQFNDACTLKSRAVR